MPSSLSGAFFCDVRTPQRLDEHLMITVLALGMQDLRWGSEGSFATHGQVYVCA